jgi:hypothetical protein
MMKGCPPRAKEIVLGQCGGATTNQMTSKSG